MMLPKLRDVAAIRRRVFDAIAEQWPELPDECERQR
jgi:hypothetical protein